MIAMPTIDDMLEGVILALDTDILPHVQNPKAQATALMMQSLLQGIRQVLPEYAAGLVDGHNELNAGLRNAAQALEGVDGPEADRVRERAASLGAADDLPAPADVEAIRLAYQARGEAVRDCMLDLDALQRAGVGAADEALTALRTMITPGSLRVLSTFPIQGGLLGRG